MTFKLQEKDVEFLHSLTEDQLNNWRSLISYLKERWNNNYDHSSFSAQNANGYCALSYAIRAKIVNYIDNSFDSYDVECEKAFGNGSWSFFGHWGEDTDFAIFEIARDEDIHLAHCKARDAAQAIEIFIDMRDIKNYSTVSIHWSDGTVDKFKSKEAAKEYLDLNPHRTLHVKKLTGTMLIPRTVYDEVTEDIKL